MQKLPLRATWLAALMMPWQHRGTFFKIMWPWVLVGGAVYAVSVVLTFAAQQEPSQSIVMDFVAFAVGVAGVVLVSPAMVAALRFVVTDEAKLHGFGKRTKSFVVAYLIFMVGWLPVTSLNIFAGQTITPAGEVAFQRPDLMAYFVVLTLVLLPVYMRLGFVFPGIADDEPVDFARAWGRTKGNTIRIVFGHLVLVVGVAFVGTFAIAITGWLLVYLLSIPQLLFQILTGVLYAAFAAYMGICILSWFGLSYLALASNRPEPQAPVSDTGNGSTGNGE